MWGTYGAGLWEARVGQSGIQDVPRYSPQIPRSNYVLGAVLLLAVLWYAHQHMGRRR